jgi:hypothetical protein
MGTITVNNTFKNGFQADIGLNYINDKSGIHVKLFVTDIFRTSSPEDAYYSDGVRQVYDNYYDSRSVELALTWRFGNWYNRNVSRRQLQTWKSKKGFNS